MNEQSNSLLEAINQIKSQQNKVGELNTNDKYTSKSGNNNNSQVKNNIEEKSKINKSNNLNTDLKTDLNNDINKELKDSKDLSSGNNDELYNEIAEQLKQLGSINHNKSKMKNVLQTKVDWNSKVFK